ncbi:MAG: response regulator [Elainellaceae cyanobacterium]
MTLVNHDVLAKEGYPPTVLAVDDDSDNLLLLGYILEGFNCMTLAESDGRAALELAQKIKPKLILLDILLPSLSGIEIIRHLKSNPHTCDIPVIAVTALARQDDQEMLLAEGFSSYISKPYLLTEVERMIGRYLIEL